jgi:hypothetical protein
VLELQTNAHHRGTHRVEQLAKVTYPSTSRLILILVCKKVSLSTYILIILSDFKFSFLKSV